MLWSKVVHSLPLPNVLMTIFQVLGDKIIEYSDRTKLKYVDAVIMEIQRCAHLGNHINSNST
jgi:hypothetical protein